jgi:Mn-dependent DtxR family transcriptional regulator
VEPFAFASGMTWKQINDLFQFKLILAHLKSGVAISDLADKLDLKTSTYYAIKRKLAQHGYDLAAKEDKIPVSLSTTHSQALDRYISNLLTCKWAEANQKFEKEIMEYLFKQVGYHKNRLAQELDVSYPTVLQKTKSLSQ